MGKEKSKSFYLSRSLFLTLHKGFFEVVWSKWINGMTSPCVGKVFPLFPSWELLHFSAGLDAGTWSSLGSEKLIRRERIPPLYNTTEPGGCMRTGPFSSGTEWISVGRTLRVQVCRAKKVATRHRIVHFLLWLQWPCVEKAALASFSSAGCSMGRLCAGFWLKMGILYGMCPNCPHANHHPSALLQLRCFPQTISWFFDFPVSLILLK